MGRIPIAMKIGFVWAIFAFLMGCAQIQESMVPKVESQNKKTDQLTAKLIKSKQANLALKEENKTLKADKLKLMKTNLKLKKEKQALAMKIDILKILDHRVEEKRKNYTSE